MQINPKLLLQVVEIVDHGSLTEAAKALNATQPALSRNLRELESQMGISIVVRGRSGALPTEFGDRVLRYARVIREMLDRISKEADAWHNGEIGPLQIGATPHPSAIITPTLIEFLKSRPNVKAELSVSGLIPLMERLERGELDLVVGPAGMLQPPEGILVDILYTDELVLLAGRDHPLTRKSAINARDLQEARWFGSPKDSAIRRQSMSILASMGLTEIQISVELSSLGDSIEMLKSGQYLAILPRQSVANALKEGEIVNLPLKLESRLWPIGIFHRDTTRTPKIVVNFIVSLKSGF
ncbi:MAG: LysR family transcriptional regulator [Sphingomonadales bacterium]|nr:LysR family transcriptional regulator [Sphingomonadales bacterium]